MATALVQTLAKLKRQSVVLLAQVHGLSSTQNTNYRTGTRPRLQTCTQQVSDAAAAANFPTRRITAITADT